MSLGGLLQNFSRQRAVMEISRAGANAAQLRSSARPDRLRPSAGRTSPGRGASPAFPSEPRKIRRAAQCSVHGDGGRGAGLGRSRLPGDPRGPPAAQRPVPPPQRARDVLRRGGLAGELRRSVPRGFFRTRGRLARADASHPGGTAARRKSPSSWRSRGAGWRKRSGVRSSGSARRFSGRRRNGSGCSRRPATSTIRRAAWCPLRRGTRGRTPGA